MSDLSTTLEAKHRPSTPPRLQLAVSSYFDEALFREEQRLIFDAGPRYVGHALAVPEVGDFHVLQHEGDGRALVRGPEGVQLVSNICRHRQAVMLQGRGNTGGQVVCPLHRWTYGLDGQLKGAPHFQQDPCLHLRNYPLQQWNGLLFEAGGRAVADELRALGTAGALDFSGYVFDRAVVHECAYNWKTFIEVYLEDYHVGPFHPGLGNLVTCDDLRWEFGAQYSVQTVGLKPRLDRPGSPVYARYHDALQRWQNGRTPGPGRGLVDAVPHGDGGVVPGRADGLHAARRVASEDRQRGRVLLPRGSGVVRTRTGRRATGGLHGNLCRGRRDRAAHGRRAPRADAAR